MRPQRRASKDDHDEAHEAHPEQVISKLRDTDRMLAEHKSIAEIAKELGVSKNTDHRWRNQFGGLGRHDEAMAAAVFAAAWRPTPPHR